LEDRTTGQFPDYNPTDTCDHLINTCKRCLKQWIESQIETTVFTPHIQCPQCDKKMDSRDVEMAVPKKMFARWVSKYSMMLILFPNTDSISQVRRA
jgi:ariadne-1